MLELGLGDDEGLELREEDADDEGLLLTELEGLGEELGEELGDGELLGEDEGDVAGALKVIHAMAPSSALVPPVQVRVAVPAVVELAVVKRKPPASMSMSSVALAQVFATVSVAPAAIAKKPPSVGMV